MADAAGTESWVQIVAGIEALIAETRRSPKYLRERDWHRARHAIDIEDVLSTPEGRLGFHAGMLHERCVRECET